MAECGQQTGMQLGGRPPAAFGGEVLRAFLYPLKGRGVYMLLGWVLIQMVFGAVRTAARIARIGLVGGIIGLALTVYACCYLLSVVRSSAGSEDEPPDWPDLGNWWDEAVKPLVLLLGAIMISLGPAAAAWAFQPEGRPGLQTLTWALLVAGLLWLPMNILAAAMFESLPAWNIVRTVVACFRVGLPYLLACAAMAAIVALVWAMERFLTPHIPVFGTVVSSGIGLYLMMAEMRIIGLIYRFHEDRIGWFSP